MGQLDLIDICMAFHPKTMEFTFLSRAYGTFSSIDHTLGHKYSLDKLKKKNWNHFKHLFWSQCNKIRCQLQDKNNYYKCKHIQAKQHAPE